MIMIEIIKHGTKQKTTCKKCGCLFSFENEDLKTRYENPNTGMINCPQCNNEIVIFAKRRSVGR